MKKEDAIEIAKPIFKNHDVTELHVTSDGQVHLKYDNAKTHASKTLKNTEVHSIKRSEAIEENAATKTDKEATQNTEGATASGKSEEDKEDKSSKKK